MAKQEPMDKPPIRVHIRKPYFDGAHLHKAKSIITLPGDFFDRPGGKRHPLPRGWTIIKSETDIPADEKTPTDQRISASQMQARQASVRAADLNKPVGMQED